MPFYDFLSRKYRAKSEALLLEYIEGEIDYETYKNSLKDIKEEELKRHITGKGTVEIEIYTYEQEIKKHYKKELETLKINIKMKALNKQQAYYEIEVPRIINEYRQKSSFNRKIHNTFQWVIIVASVIVTSTTSATVVTDAFRLSYWFKWVAAILSILVSISAGVTGYFKFRERSSNLQETADDIEQEHKALALKIGVYRGKPEEEALSIFAENVENLRMEQRKREQTLEQPPDTKHGQIRMQN